jgi:hypothetical protein
VILFEVSLETLRHLKGAMFQNRMVTLVVPNAVSAFDINVFDLVIQPLGQSGHFVAISFCHK